MRQRLTGMASVRATLAMPGHPTNSATAQALDVAATRPPVGVRFAAAPSRAHVPWKVRDVDPDAVLTLLRWRYPEAVCWYGDFTGRYWFLSPYRVLVGASDANELVRLLGVCFPPSARPQQSGVGARPLQRRAVRVQRASRRAAAAEGAEMAVRMTLPEPAGRSGLLRRLFGWMAGRQAATRQDRSNGRGKRVDLWDASW